MHNYRAVKSNYGNPVSQTLNDPILVVDYFELGDLFTALMIVLVFGVIAHSWWLLIVSLVFYLGVGPAIKRRNPKGIFLHWPYQHLRMSLPGLPNPMGNRKMSD